MERLTKRDRKGRAYFDDDGALIRGANGIFHQKKDMTAQYIHQRFVALDKAIDCLAAYEDTGLEPEEIMALIDPPNPPLTLDELREMDGEPVYLSPGECWVLVSQNDFAPIFTWEDGSSCSACDWYAEIGPAHRRRPEGGTA